MLEAIQYIGLHDNEVAMQIAIFALCRPISDCM